MKLSILNIAFAFMFVAASRVQAELQPQEVAILANGSSASSKAVAEYYAKARQIPNQQICLVNMSSEEILKREEWEEKVRPAIRKWVASNQLQSKIKCFVTVWDVPLKIDRPVTVADDDRRRTEFLKLERDRRMERMLQFSSRIEGAGKTTAEPNKLTVKSTLKEVTDHLNGVLKAAEGRIRAMTDTEAKQATTTELTQLSVAVAGLSFVAQNFQSTLQSGQTSERLVSEFQFTRGRLAGLAEGQGLLEGLPASVERDGHVLSAIERSAGIAGTIAWIDEQLSILEKNETYASFDSELSVLFRDPGYPLLRWRTNFMHYNYDESPMRRLHPTLMVSRLEAPTLQLTKALIDTAIEVEKSGGLKGKIYLDARGIGKLEETAPATGSIGDYDRALLFTAQVLQECSSLEVVLDERNDLFAAGECPDAALYCGWYSLANYIDAFEWKPGAIGYHMASNEAATIRNGASQVWCKRMIEDGVAATLGPVYEPYLMAFPRPNELLPLLLSGKFTYVEAVYRTKAFNSWVITVIGDPLYNPFKNGTGLKKDLPAAYNRVLGVPQ